MKYRKITVTAVDQNSVLLDSTIILVPADKTRLRVGVLWNGNLAEYDILELGESKPEQEIEMDDVKEGEET